MPRIARQALSGSTDGRPIAVAATVTPGTLIHTAVTGTSDFDEIYIWAVNTSASAVLLTVEYGGTAAGDLIEFSVASEDGLHLVTPGLVLQNGLIVRAFAATASVINLVGYVNRITA